MSDIEKMFKIIPLSKEGIPLSKEPYSKLIEYDKFRDFSKYDYGLVPNPGFIVLDVDDLEEAKRFLNHLTSENKKFCCMQTTRGMHFWFRTNEEYLNQCGYRNALGVKIDIRCGGKKCFLRAKKNGEWRKWIHKDNELDIIEDYMLPNVKYQNIDFSGVETGRNNTLYKVIAVAGSLGYKQKDKELVANYLNKVLFYEELQANEFESCLRNHKYFQGDGKYSSFQSDKFKLDEDILSINYSWDINTKSKQLDSISINNKRLDINDIKKLINIINTSEKPAKPKLKVNGEIKRSEPKNTQGFNQK